MLYPRSVSIPWELPWHKEYAFAVIDHVATRTPERCKLPHRVEFSASKKGTGASKFGPLGTYWHAYHTERFLGIRRRVNASAAGSVSIFVESIKEYVGEVIPLKTSAYYDKIACLGIYVAAHELGHKFHLDSPHSLTKPGQYLKTIDLQFRTKLIEYSLPHTLWNAGLQVTEAVAKLTQYRLKYLSTDTKESHSVPFVELIAHLAAMTTLGEVIEARNLPAESAAFQLEIADSLLNMHNVMCELPASQRLNLTHALRWIEAEGDETTDKPLLVNRTRLLAIKAKAQQASVT